MIAPVKSGETRNEVRETTPKGKETPNAKEPAPDVKNRMNDVSAESKKKDEKLASREKELVIKGENLERTRQEFKQQETERNARVQEYAEHARIAQDSVSNEDLNRATGDAIKARTGVYETEKAIRKNKEELADVRKQRKQSDS
jgi:hypothetical protein